MPSVCPEISDCNGFICCIGCMSLIPGVLRKVVKQMAFFPPRPAGYYLKDGQEVFLVEDDQCLTPLPDLTDQGIVVDTVRMWTPRGNCIIGFHFRTDDSSKTLLFSHGNSTDIGTMFHHLKDLCLQLQVDVFAYEYSGYGESSGEPSEANIYADIEAAHLYLTVDRGIPPDQVVLYGQSIGSAPSLDLASRTTVGGVILHSALRSGLGCLLRELKANYWFDVFPNITKIGKVRAPVFIMHGTHDLETPWDHGVALYEACPEEFAYEPWWVRDAGHNDIEINRRGLFYEKLREFLNSLDSSDLFRRRMAIGEAEDDYKDGGAFDSGRQPLLLV